MLRFETQYILEMRWEEHVQKNDYYIIVLPFREERDLRKTRGIYSYSCFLTFWSIFNYRVIPSNKQKWNWKIETSLGAIGAQDLFFSLYKLGVNFLWIENVFFLKASLREM